MKTMDVEVVDIRKIHGAGKTKAAADIKVSGELVIKGVFVMEGKNGLFVSLPRKASRDGRYFDVLEVESSLKDHIEKKVLESYELETDGVKD